MLYKLLQMALRRTPTTLCEFQLDQKIVDLCFAEGLGFFFIAGQAIGQITLDGKLVYPFIGQPEVCLSRGGFRKRVTFENPASLCYRPSNKNLLVLEKNGRNIWALNVLSDFYCQAAFSNDIQRQANTYYNPHALQGAACLRVEDHLIAWSISSMHRIFCLNGSSLEVIGNGKQGFSVANTEVHCQLAQPSGIALKNAALFVADKGNHCIRKFLQGYQLVMGHPLEIDFCPEQPLFIGDALCFVDRQMIKQMTNLRATPIMIHQNTAASFLLADMGKKMLAILECYAQS